MNEKVVVNENVLKKWLDMLALEKAQKDIERQMTLLYQLVPDMPKMKKSCQNM
ncbi:MAG: hypothetical protein AAFR81_25850 [Chloroflexota bacterium]